MHRAYASDSDGRRAAVGPDFVEIGYAGSRSEFVRDHVRVCRLGGKRVDAAKAGCSHGVGDP